MVLKIMLYFLYFNFFYFGAILGSFLNVLTKEIEPNVFQEKGTDYSLKGLWKRMNRRSHCPHCQKNLKPKNLFPIFSFLVQKGKCAFCGKKISARYLIVEIFSGLIFMLLFITVFTKYGLNFPPAFWAEYLWLTPIFMGLIIIFLFDWKHKIIPNIVIYPTFILTALYSLNYLGGWKIFLHAIYFALPFFLLWLLSRGKAMGFADWKLVFLLSILIPGISLKIFFVFASFWIGALYFGPQLIWSKKHSLKSEVPFGPFILLSFFLTYFFSVTILNFWQIVL